MVLLFSFFLSQCQGALFPSPHSSFLADHDDLGAIIDSVFSYQNATARFCAIWNPDFIKNGLECCPTRKPKQKRRVKRASYCSDMTEQQKIEAFETLNGERGDVLSYLERLLPLKKEQAFCSVNQGFLAYGRMILPSEENRILLRAPERCLNFGTDLMATLLEWTGRQIAERYSETGYEKVKLILGHVSAPRGGYIGHLSHTSGQDADIGFLTAKRNQPSPVQFHSQLDTAVNGWLIETILQNSYAPIKVIFLDRSHIRALQKGASKGNYSWDILKKCLKHSPGHRNHFHVRIATTVDEPGCLAGAKTDLEPLALDEDELSDDAIFSASKP